MEKYDNFKKITDLIPLNGGKIDWAGFDNTDLKYIFDEMAKTNQNPEYHGEIDVLTHTKMVCEALVKQPEYTAGSKNDKMILFLSALLHDIGKIKCTVIEDGEIRSPHHSPIGSVMAREILWKEFGLCGSSEKQQLREAVCSLIRYHSFPPYAISNTNPEFRLLKIASNGELAKDFSIEKLCVLERADVLGRISKDADEILERIECCRLLAQEEGCLNHPFQFANSFSKWAYFKGKTLWKEQDMFNNTWGEVILMSGLPGTGKDTWIKETHPDIPMISLDEIRKEFKISPTENQTPVISIGHERAKEYLRKKQPFIWNATNITAQIRGMQISLFEEYGASVKTVFLETEWTEQLRRNKNREAQVPLAAIENMLSRLMLPERYECEKVSWQIV